MIIDNLNEQPFGTIWNGPHAVEIRRQICTRTQQFRMIGSATAAMKKSI